MTVHVEWAAAECVAVTVSRPGVPMPDGQSPDDPEHWTLALSGDDVMAIVGTRPQLRRLLRRIQAQLDTWP